MSLLKIERSISKWIKGMRLIILGFWFSCCLLFFFPALLVTLYFSPLHAIAHRIRRLGLKLFFLIGGIRIQIVREQPIKIQAPYVIVANHTSKLDIISMLTYTGVDLVFMAKHHFANIPFLGVFFKTIDIQVWTADSFKSASAFRKALRLLSTGTSVVVYPEGGIARITPKLSPFMDGAFLLAIKAQADILPVTNIHHWEVLPNLKFEFNPGKVIQHIHTPISTKGMTTADIPALKQKVFDIIASKLAAYGYHQSVDR